MFKLRKVKAALESKYLSGGGEDAYSASSRV